MSEKNTSITKSMILVSMASMLTLIFSFLKETVTANYFGMSAEADAYTIAVQLPVVLFSVVSSATTTVVLPVYSKKCIKESKESANKYASNLITILVCILSILVMFSILCAKQILRVTAPGLPQEQMSLAVFIFRMVVPTVICTIIIKLNNGIMNFYNEFTKPVLIVNLLNITFSVIVILFAGKYGIMSAVAGVLIGTFLEFMASCLMRRRYMKYRITFNLHDAAMKESVIMSVPVLIGMGVDEIGKVFDKMVASMLKTGSISSLNYASRLSSAISSLFLTGITTVTYPEYTKDVAEGNDKSASKIFLYSIQLYLIIVLPIVIGGSFLSKEIIMIVFCRGAFGMDSVAATAPLFCWYLLNLFFSATRNTCSDLFYAYGDTKTPMINSSIGIILNIILNFILAYKFGTQGVAAATAISTATVGIMLMMQVKKKNKYISYINIMKTLWKIAVGVVIMLLTLSVVKYCFVQANIYNLSGTQNNILFVAVSVLAAGSVYFLVLILLRCEGMDGIIKNFSNYNNKRRKKK